MSRSEAVEFVCYHEGGIVNLQRAMDDILEPSLDQILAFKAPVETPEAPGKRVASAPVQFHPRLQSLDFFLAPDDLKAQADRESALSDAFEITTSPLERIFTSSGGRVYPFQQALGGLAATVDHLPQFFERDDVSLPSKAAAHTFHDRLLARSRDCDMIRRRKVSSRIMFWNSVILFLVAEFTLYGGVAALLVGLMGLTRGVSVSTIEGMVFSIGVISLGCTVLIRSSWKLNWKELVCLDRP